MSETVKLLKSNESKTTKDKNFENVSNLEIREIALVHYNIVNSDCTESLRVLYTLIPNKLFDKLLDIFPKNFIILKTFNSEFPYIEAWFIDQISKPLEIQDKIDISLVIN